MRRVIKWPTMIEKIFLRTINDNRMILPGDTVIIGVSGGADSSALLHLFAMFRKELGIKLTVCHLNHKIRGRDAACDEKYIMEISRKLGIRCVTESFDVPAFAKRNRLSLEDAARRARHGFFNRTAKSIGADKIALGHTADDNVETLLMRMIRGAGLRGLEGIPKVRGMIIRPLINIWRSDLEGFCRKHSISPRIDKTNYDTAFFRNRVRHELIPHLQKYNPRIKETLSRLIDILGQHYDFLESETIKYASKVLKGKKDRVDIDKKKLLHLRPILQAEILRLAIEKVKGDLFDISYVNILDILASIKKTSATISIPGLQIYIGRNSVAVSPGGERTDVRYKHFLTIPGRIRVAGGRYMVRASLVEPGRLKRLKHTNPNVAYVDLGKISGPLWVRSWEKGDRMRPMGFKGTKKLQDIFIDEKVDMREKALLPIVSDSKKIVWVSGFRIDDKVKVDPGTSKIVKLECSRRGR